MDQRKLTLEHAEVEADDEACPDRSLHPADAIRGVGEQDKSGIRGQTANQNGRLLLNACVLDTLLHQPEQRRNRR